MISNGLLNEVECDRVVMKLGHGTCEVEIDPSIGKEVVREEVGHISFVTPRAFRRLVRRFFFVLSKGVTEELLERGSDGLGEFAILSGDNRWNWTSSGIAEGVEGL